MKKINSLATIMFEKYLNLIIDISERKILEEVKILLNKE